mgnify:CR=1 FL=1
MQIILASRNPGKIREIHQILDNDNLEIVGLDAFPELPEIPEEQDSFEGNALQKARFVHERTGLLCVADDSGLEVDALNGAPGVRSKRFTPEATSSSNNRALLRVMQDANQRSARFRCAIAVVGSVGEATACGSCEGEIAYQARGTGGFGYDPLFLPVAYPGRSMAEISTAEKNRISHRGEAFRQLPEILARLGFTPEPSH